MTPARRQRARFGRVLQLATLEAQCDDAQCAWETETQARMATGMRFFRTLLAMPQMRSADGEKMLTDAALDAITDLLGKNNEAIQDELNVFARVLETLPPDTAYVVDRTRAWLMEPPLENKLRNPSTRSQTLECIAERVVNALVQGVS